MDKPDRHIPPFILSSPLRSIFENPYSTLRKYVKEGMTVVDHGCGPGFYTIPMSSLVGETGRVIAIDSDERSIGVLQSSRKRGDH